MTHNATNKPNDEHKIEKLFEEPTEESLLQDLVQERANLDEDIALLLYYLEKAEDETQDDQD